ncbi:MAG: metallophosphoesterase [Thermovirgaceae bacterium]
MFLLIFLALYGIANWYITSRVFRILPLRGPWKLFSLSLWLFLVFAFPVGRLCTAFCRSTFSDWMLWLGSWYLGAMVYSLFFFAIIDLLRFLSHLWLRLKSPDSKNQIKLPERHRLRLLAAYSLFIIFVVTAGHYNAIRPVVRSYELSLPQRSDGGTVRVALVSDIHGGIMVDNHWLQRIVKTINETAPDVVLLAGDTVDGNVTHSQEERLSEVLAELSAPLGVYAVPGNHEYYTDTEEAVHAIESGNVTVLLDEAVEIEGLFILAGRKDIAAEQFGEKRKSLEGILTETGNALAVIVMDHTPVNLEEAAEAGIALQVSGHTHRGQLFPFNFITGMLFEQDWGFLRKKDTLFYVSCGAGTWGPPIRTSSRPEVVLFDITFTAGDDLREFREEE